MCGAVGSTAVDEHLEYESSFKFLLTLIDEKNVFSFFSEWLGSLWLR